MSSWLRWKPWMSRDSEQKHSREKSSVCQFPYMVEPSWARPNNFFKYHTLRFYPWKWDGDSRHNFTCPANSANSLKLFVQQNQRKSNGSKTFLRQRRKLAQSSPQSTNSAAFGAKFDDKQSKSVLSMSTSIKSSLSPLSNGVFDLSVFRKLTSWHRWQRKGKNILWQR